ncbi:hypothetical protein H072_4226 [Dactylellina haptotyla CBS 200.50]|uniref:Uncharacterized protein n=1 Tax=Dactylellina haptotyla (strain CBS 200.50) TaxID=1284197 RepID=S8AG90_DACHA|nr:hypothetical protein H072_4226 [Dactylellina haptotyla CBS 200.50]
MPQKIRRSNKRTRKEDALLLRVAKTPTALLIPELLELILSFVVNSYTKGAQDEELMGLKILWSKCRAVCRFWKEVVETSTLPSIASITFHSKAMVQDHSPTNFIVHKLAKNWFEAVPSIEEDLSRRAGIPRLVPKALVQYRKQKYHTMFATYLAVTIMRAFAAETTVKKIHITQVNNHYMGFSDAVVTWENKDRFWYFETNDGITVEHFVAFATNIYEIGRENLASKAGGKADMVRIEFLGPDEGVVGSVSMPTRVSTRG